MRLPLRWRKDKRIQGPGSPLADPKRQYPQMEPRVLEADIPKAELISYCSEPSGTGIQLPHMRTDAENAAMIAGSGTQPQWPEQPKRTSVLLAIHTSRDADTAVYKDTRNRAAYLEQQGCECTIISADDLVGRFGGRFTPITYPLALAWWLLRRANAYDVAVFHSYAGWAVLTLSAFLPRFRRLHTAIHFHGLEPLYYSRLQAQASREGHPLSWRYRLVSGHLMLRLLRLACRRAGVVFCLNTEEKRFLVDNGWATSERVRVVANPAPDSFFLRREYRQRATKLLFVAQWLRMKGTQCLVEAFTTLHRENPDLRLVCAGTLAGADAVLGHFPAEVRDSVSVLPRVSNSELVDLHRDADLFVFPTLSEGFSVAIVEAMASGLPIVTTAVGAAPDILEDEQSVVFCPTNQPDVMSRKIADLLDDPARRQHLGRNAQHAAERLRPSQVWHDYWEGLKQLANCDKDKGRDILVSRPSQTQGD